MTPPPVSLGGDQFLTLAATDTFYNSGIVPTDDGRGFSVTLRGAAASLSTGPKDLVADRRLSLFSVWSHSAVLVALFTIVAGSGRP